VVAVHVRYYCVIVNLLNLWPFSRCIIVMNNPTIGDLVDSRKVEELVKHSDRKLVFSNKFLFVKIIAFGLWTKIKM
jgi:hypothetical protein